MKNIFFGVLIGAALTVGGLHARSIVHAHMSQHGAAGAANVPPTHVENSFDFVVHGDYAQVAPLFGAWGERAWGGEQWQPHFVYPVPAKDVAGEVFTVTHGHANVFWVNTAFDPDAGFIQYVYVVPDFQVTIIDIHLKRPAANEVGVHVTYKRTALQSQVNDHIVELGNKDRDSAKEWQDAIQKYLDRKK